MSSTIGTGEGLIGLHSRRFIVSSEDIGSSTQGGISSLRLSDANGTQPSTLRPV
jgi:hypothetical protein